MSLENTRDIGTAKIVMVGAGGGGTSYNAGTGIDITNNTIHNTECGARSGIIDSISSSRAHTQITLATNETFKPYETLILHSATSGTADILRIQYASAASSVYDFNFYDRDGATAKTVSLEDGKTIIVMLDQTGHKAIVLSEIVSEVPLSIAHGGTGNIYGYIRTGKKAGTSFYAGATIEGYDNTNEGAYAHAEGQDNTIASTAQASHVEGYYNTVSGQNGHAEGQRNQASNTNAHAEGYYTVASGEASHAEGGIEIIGTDRYPNTASGKYSHAEGGGNTASGNYSHVEGRRNLASAYTAHAEGASTTANNDSAHAEGEHTLSSSTASHAEGSHSTASGVGAHSEGSYYTDFDTGNIVGNTASAEGSHAEGIGTSASGTASHSEGYGTSASGNYSHASGGSTTAGYAYQTVVGKINDNKSSTLFEVGNGTGANARSNAFEVYSDGKISCDNGSSKFQFTQNNGSDGYYDASGVFHAFGGSGNTVSKTRYQISSSSWSSSANADGFYTLTATLNPAIGSSPDVYIAGNADGTQPTDTEKGQFAYVKRCKVNGSTLTLYASSKPSSTFYIWVEGVNGTGSGDIVGNVIQPNGESSGGGVSLSDFTAIPIYNNRATRVSGGYYVEGNKVFIQETVDVKSGLFTGSSELWSSIFNIPQNFPIPIRTAIPLKAELWVGNFMVGQSTVVYDSSARIKKYSSDDTYIEVRFPADIIPTPSDLHLTILGEYYYQ